MGGRLTALRVERLGDPGLYPDGDGLYLQITSGADETPCKSWVLRFRM